MPLLAAFLLLSPSAPPTDSPHQISAIGGASASAIAQLVARVTIISGVRIDARAWQPGRTPHQRATTDRLTGASLRLTEFE